MLALLQIYPCDLWLVLYSRVTNAYVSRWSTEIETFLNSHGNPPPAYMSLLNHYVCPQYDVARWSIVCSVMWTVSSLLAGTVHSGSTRPKTNMRSTAWPLPWWETKAPSFSVVITHNYACMRVLWFKFLGAWWKIPSKKYPRNYLDDLSNHPVLSYSFKDFNWILSTNAVTVQTGKSSLMLINR